MQAAPKRAWRPLRREHGLLVLCVLLLLLATIPPLINLGRYQRRITGAISRSIGRPVTIRSVSLRLLPWPGFVLTDLSIAEEPAFGAEPSLRAPEVVVEPRLWSLWRGRFELSHVDLSDASVNLVRAADGRWNIGSVLLQASHVTNAPTGQRHAGPAPRFPYIEATGTRINVKKGAEKLPYSLLDADFSMWLARPGVWGIKLEGQPVRTDLAIAIEDTGTLRLQGEVHRASAMGALPVSMQGSWEHAPIGELGRLLLGRDTGWRGDLNATARFSGEIDNLHVGTHLVIDNLHHQEFTPEEPFAVDASCRGLYSRSTPSRDAFRCHWPLGDGGLALLHTANSAPGSLQLEANNVPAHALAAAVHLVQPGAPPADRFTGELSGSLAWNPGDRSLSGAMQMPTLSIAAAQPDGSSLLLHGLTITAAPGVAPSLLFAAQPLAMGVPNSPMVLGAELARGQWRLHASGAATLDALRAAASALHVPFVPNLSPLEPGKATVDLAVSTAGEWLSGDGSDEPLTASTGTLHLQNVQWSPRWLPLSIALPAANATLGPDSIRWSSPSAVLGNGAEGLHLSGFLATPLHCGASKGTAACASEFSLATPSLNVGRLGTLLSGGPARLFSALLRQFDFSALHLPAFSGSLRATVLSVGRLPLQDAAIVLAHAPGTGPVVQLQSIDGGMLGGTVHMSGSVALSSGSAPRYTLEAAVTGASAPQAAALWHENWGPGILGGSARFSTTGANETDLLGSVAGTFHLAWQHGSLRSVLPPFAIWDATGTLGPQGLSIAHSELSGTAETMQGTIGWDRTLQLTLRPGAGAAAVPVSGTLATPHAEPSSTAAP